MPITNLITNLPSPALSQSKLLPLPLPELLHGGFASNSHPHPFHLFDSAGARRVLSFLRLLGGQWPRDELFDMFNSRPNAPSSI